MIDFYYISQPNKSFAWLSDPNNAKNPSPVRKDGMVKFYALTEIFRQLQDIGFGI